MKTISIWNIFLVFTKIGAFTIGGGYVMVPAIEAEMKKQGWLSDDELPDIVALAQSAPGLLTVNMSIFAGYRLRGIAGSIAATAGCILAPFITILLIAMFFSSIKDNPVVTRVFNGVRPAAVAVITGYFINLLRRNAAWWKWAITLVALACMVLLKISAIYILLAVIIGAVALSLYNRRNAR